MSQGAGMIELQAVRGGVSIGQTAILAYRPRLNEHAITLASGVGLSGLSPIGGFLSHMLKDRHDEWWIALLRPGGPPTTIERDVAATLCDAAKTVGINLRTVVLATGRKSWILAGSSAEHLGLVG